MPNNQKRGYAVLKDEVLNKSSAFSHAEREDLGLRGLLPYLVNTQDNQVNRVLANMRRKDSDIERYIFLSALQMRAEKLFYRVIIENFDEITPIIYTPTVGQACKEFAHIFRMPKGFFITPDDKGQIETIMDNWPDKEVQVIVITDGERILGLGDLGSSGMGIPIGKLALYTACAGIDPQHCMPVMFDVGTNNQAFLDDPLYLGYPNTRLSGEAYDELMDEFIQAVKHKYPNAIVQFEDFLTPNAYRLLNQYRNEIPSFNDDIQGTAAVTLAGVIASTRITGIELKDLRILFLGAGSAATGIGELIVAAMQEDGLSQAEAIERLWFVKSDGLMIEGNPKLTEHQQFFAQPQESMDFKTALKKHQPHILIGATGSPNTFTEEIVNLMSEYNERPTIFALSNPTSRAECTAEQAYSWSKGQAIFASGSPFAPIDYAGKTLKPGQGNNAYIFPGVGLGALACKASSITDEMFLAAARTLAKTIQQSDLDTATLYPPLQSIREVSLDIAVAVAEMAYVQGLAQLDRPTNLRTFIQAQMYDPYY